MRFFTTDYSLFNFYVVSAQFTILNGEFFGMSFIRSFSPCFSLFFVMQQPNVVERLRYASYYQCKMIHQGWMSTFDAFFDSVFFHQEKPFDAFVSHTLANISQIYILPMTFSHSRVSEWMTEWKLSKRNEEKKNQVYYCIPLRYGMVSSCQQCALLRHDVSIGAFSSIRESDGILM